MFITTTITKKLLEEIIKGSVSSLGFTKTALLLDTLKLLGFSYATISGLSISIEDLKIPTYKEASIKIAKEEIERISRIWHIGEISEIERFQFIIDNWHSVTESIKNSVIEYFENFDPLNNLYIMAFSGARGNISQVRQLVGMRGLMSDSEGNIINLPIKSNFKEGLSSLDYIISSYGARKGTVDTALKTADSGYLTRRLIYIAQDTIIRQVNCKSDRGICIFLNKNTSIKSLLGRTIVTSNTNVPVFINENIFKSLISFKKFDILKIRSPLTCNTSSSICQYCYGWDLTKKQVISLGEAVGIIAAQSIGEPGTQLTMRTFHTGGVFTSEAVKQIRAPYTGIIQIPHLIKEDSIRTNQGLTAYKINRQITLSLIDWKNVKSEILLRAGSLLYLGNSSIICKGDLIAEEPSKKSVADLKEFQLLYSPSNGKILFDNLVIKSISSRKKAYFVEKEGLLWLLNRTLLDLPINANYKFQKKLDKKIALAKINLVCPHSGYIFFKEDQFTIKSNDLNYGLNISEFSILQKKEDFNTKFIPLVRNCQYIDPFTIIGAFYLFPKFNGYIYEIEKVENDNTAKFSLITSKDIWKIYSDSVNISYNTKGYIKTGSFINATQKSAESGILFKKEGHEIIFQKAFPIFLKHGEIIKVQDNSTILEGDILGMRLYSKMQTEDIVQGLPKIENLIEARVPFKNENATIAIHPGIYLGSFQNKGDLHIDFSKTQRSIKYYKFHEEFLFTQVSKNRSRFTFILGNLNLIHTQPIQYLSKSLPLKLRKGYFVNLCEPVTSGKISVQDLLDALFAYHKNKDGLVEGTLNAINKLQLILINSIQGVYQSQNISISNKHIEIIVRQMTNFVEILDSGATPFLEKEQVNLSLVLAIINSFREMKNDFHKYPNFKPLLLATTTATLLKSGFLANASFQETRRILTKAAIAGKSDWLRGLKDSIMTGRLMPAGSSFLQNKNYIDSLYNFN